MDDYETVKAYFTALGRFVPVWLKWFCPHCLNGFSGADIGKVNRTDNGYECPLCTHVLIYCRVNTPEEDARILEAHTAQQKNIEADKQ
jgi:hypothetical protein